MRTRDKEHLAGVFNVPVEKIIDLDETQFNLAKNKRTYGYSAVGDNSTEEFYVFILFIYLFILF